MTEPSRQLVKGVSTVTVRDWIDRVKLGLFITAVATFVALIVGGVIWALTSSHGGWFLALLIILLGCYVGYMIVWGVQESIKEKNPMCSCGHRENFHYQYTRACRTYGCDCERFTEREADHPNA